jgi:aerobic C4-dicarboxylate transport protein
VQVLIAIGVGILLGAVFPKLAVDIKPISDGFIMLIRSVVPLIIFATVAVGIAKMGDIRRVGVVRLRAIIYFEVVSTLALLVGLAVGNLLQLGAGLRIILTRLRLHYFRTDSVTDAEFMLLVGTSNGEDIRFQPA